MSSPTGSIGVLREMPCIQNISAPLLEPRKVPEIIFTNEKEIPVTKCATLLSETLSMILGNREKTKGKSTYSIKKLGDKEINQHFKDRVINAAVVENASISKMLALYYLHKGKELEACCHLIASQGACLRQQILYRSLKFKCRTSMLNEPMVNNLNPEDLDNDLLNINTNPKMLLHTLAELPTEWYVLQITAEHERIQNIRHRMQPAESMYSFKPMHAIHLVILHTGNNVINPFCITLPKPNSESTYDIRTEIETLLNNNKSNLTATYNNYDLYWKMRCKQNEKMNTAISELEFSWLREWRILLLADYTEQLELVKELHNMIDKLIADSSLKVITDRTRWLLRKIATGACYLQPFEIERAVKYVLPNQTKLAKNIILSVVSMTKLMDPLKSAKRKPLILILDECLDHISFESITLLKHQPVTRFPSLHIAYALYNQHKATMKDGYKIIQKSDNLGTFIVNPSLDLQNMEIRIRTFIKYWLPKWKGLYGIKPELEFFKSALTQHDVLMYNGHGSGIQYLRGEEIERMRVQALVLLFGCGSLKLVPVGGRLPAYGVSYQYLMGCSPCILGMLWEVTDGDIDKMTCEFMSSWIPSSVKRPWSDVVSSSWCNGVIEFHKKGAKAKKSNEHDMLVAVAKSKDVCKQYMTSSAIIVRGLPVKLVNEIESQI